MPETSTPPYIPPVAPQVSDVRVQPPFVVLPSVWEYRHLAAETAPDETELNALGAAGWELVGVASAPGAVHLYFKRLAR